MALFKFFKRREREPFKDELDLPPIPPPIEGEELGLMGETELPELPEFPGEESLPEPEAEPEPKPAIAKEPEMPERMEMPEPTRRVLAERPFFVRADSFRDVLEGVNAARLALGSLEESLGNLEDLHDDKEKEFVQWHSLVDDLQRKVAFIDKSLFKGG